MDNHKALDQYYTAPHIAEQCWAGFEGVAEQLQVDLTEYTFIEPSAGSGAFYKLMPQDRRVGCE